MKLLPQNFQRVKKTQNDQGLLKKIIIPDTNLGIERQIAGRQESILGK